MEQLELMAFAVKNGIMSKNEGERIIWETLFTHRHKFSLSVLDYDSFMDFLEYLQPKFIKFLEEYNPQTCSFFTYLNNLVKSNLYNWKKNAYRQNAARDSFLSVQEITYDMENLKYEEMQKTDFETESFSTHTLEDIRNLKKIEQNLKSSQRPPKKLTRLRKDAVLILTLKSCFQVTEDIVEKVALLADVEKSVLQDLILQARESLNSKIKRRQICEKTRDNAFFYHRKYMLEKERLDGRSNWAHHIASRYERQTTIWKSANSRLKTKYCRLVPTTKTVAELLGMTVRHCEYVLKKLNTDMDKIKLKWYPLVHENISRNRKSE